ncbi:tripartite motif-containing protein brain tumor isoform X1 [Musca autumnalis]|uniref:tripartite motif-containing protein brain tumor isoform X1 n=1 Tax=Musca autumnalis TaxID=221902 RepID=UPI003CF5D26C
MNRQSQQQQQPPPPGNMSARHIHGHHNMRGPPPPNPLQQVGPPPPHALNMGFPPGPAMAPNMQQQRPNRSQNYHNFMDTTSSGIGNLGGGVPPGPPYMHYNRMSGGGGNLVGNKKYHHNPLNKPRSMKIPTHQQPQQQATSESHHHSHHPQQQQQHNQQTSALLQQQHHPQHSSYSTTPITAGPTPASASCLTEIPAISQTHAATTNLKLLGHEQRKPPQAAIQQQTKSSDVYNLNAKKINEIPRPFELNFQTTTQTAVPPTAEPTKITTNTPSSTAMEGFTIDSMKTLTLSEKSVTNTERKETSPIKEIQSSSEGTEEKPSTDDTKTDKKPVESAATSETNESHSDEAAGGGAGDKEANDFKSSREKTPMCLVNDLARFNKISFQYRLTGENGPAHCKRFTVTLKLGDEEYMAEGLKIKEAQHLAAKEAILKTKYKHPIPKANRRNDEQGASKVNVTPTVELNALAMKLGLQTYYIFDPRQSAVQDGDKANGNSHKVMPSRFRGGPVGGGVAVGIPPGGLQPGIPNQLHGMGSNVKYGGGGGTFLPPNLAHHNPALMHVQQAAAGHHHRAGGPNYQHCYPVLPQHMMVQHHHAAAALFPTPCKITLIVGTQKFIGTGRTIQQAKHDAAAQAIEALKEEMNNQQKENEEEKNDDDGDNKSPISMVFEIGIKRNLPVDFKILREDGPAHMRTFTTACIVGQIVTEADGTGKKISKKKAAQKMLEELKKLPPIETTAAGTTSPNKRVKGGAGCGGGKGGAPRKSGGHAKQGANNDMKKESAGRPRSAGGDKIKKRERMDSESADASNPITKLIEWCQHNKEKEPVFNLITEGGKERARQRQFVVEVSVKDMTVRGVGNSKKSARRNAAQNMLLALGVVDTSDKPLASTSGHQQVEESVTKVTNDKSPNSKISGNDSRAVERKVDTMILEDKEKPKEVKLSLPPQEEVKKEETSENSVTATAAPTTSSSNTSSSTTTTTSKPSSGLYMKDKLLYLAKLMGFEVDFSDYPKGNHNEFLSIVMISTNPPQICHGIGANAQESQEDAARNALKILSEMGLSK